MRKMPRGTYTLPNKEGILTIVAASLTVGLIDIDSSLVLIIPSACISISMFILDMLYCYSDQIKYLRKKITKKGKTLD